MRSLSHPISSSSLPTTRCAVKPPVVRALPRHSNKVGSAVFAHTSSSTASESCTTTSTTDSSSTTTINVTSNDSSNYSTDTSTTDSSSSNRAVRRSLLLSALTAPVLPVFTVPHAALAGEVAELTGSADAEGEVQQRAPPKPGGLEERLLTPGDVRNPGNSLFPKPGSRTGTILYPKWMFGEWRVTSRLRDFRTPLGPGAVDPGLVEAAKQELQQGEPLQYSMRFFSTLPITFMNSLKFNVGIMPNDAIADDRAFNTTSLTNATAGWEAVASASYDPTDSPDRETVEFSRLSPDMQPLPPRRAELYINNTRSESPDPSVFVTSQLYRQVMVGVRSVETSDYEVMTSYEAFGGGVVRAKQRTALYLQPYEKDYFKAQGRAVAIYDHDLELVRVPPPSDTEGYAEACVTTPKSNTEGESFVQCL